VRWVLSGRKKVSIFQKSLGKSKVAPGRGDAKLSHKREKEGPCVAAFKKNEDLQNASQEKERETKRLLQDKTAHSSSHPGRQTNFINKKEGS